jgi:hypothetical protein
MFCNPNSAEILRFSDRDMKSGLFTQLNLLSSNQEGYSCIHYLLCGKDLLSNGGISE